MLVELVLALSAVLLYKKTELNSLIFVAFSLVLAVFSWAGLVVLAGSIVGLAWQIYRKVLINP